MSDEVTNAPELRIGLINEILSEAIFIRMDEPLWKFIGWTQFCSCVKMLHFSGFLVTHYASVNGQNIMERVFMKTSRRILTPLSQDT
jgi:hypothetical protein